jgi:periplasmic protein TonB
MKGKSLKAALAAMVVASIFGCATAPNPTPVANATSFAGRYINLADADVKPHPIYMHKPKYPAGFRAAGIEGLAITTFVLDESGVPTQVQFSHATDLAFGQAAVDAVCHWRFSPAMKDGWAVACLMEIPVEFKIEK